MTIFLRAKHWQLFVLVYVIPIIFIIVMMASMMTAVFQNDQPDPLEMFHYLKYIPLVSLLSMGTKLGWEWAVGIRLQQFAPPGVVFKNTAFKIFILFIVLYYILIWVFFFSMSGIFPQMMTERRQPGPAFFLWFICIIPLAMFAVFCQFYSYYFAAKPIKQSSSSVI